MNAPSLLAELGTSMGLEGFQLDANGCVQLVFDDSVEVNFEYDEADSRLQIYSSMGNVPAEGKAEVFEMLLKANLFGIESGGSVFSIDPIAGELILFRTVQGDEMDGATFQKLIVDFVDTVETWAPKVSQSHVSSGAEGQDGSPEDGVPASMIRA